jgi:hypothetical protein
MNAMKAAAATDGSATPVRRSDDPAATPMRRSAPVDFPAVPEATRRSAPADLAACPAPTSCPPSPGSSTGPSHRGSVRLTATRHGEMPIEDAKEDSKIDERTLRKDRHAPPYGAPSELIRHLRRFELAPEGVCMKPWHEQFNKMISVMISHNPHLAVQLKWALRIIMALGALNPGCTIGYVGELSWERYVWECKGFNGKLNSRYQFLDNGGIVCNLMQWHRLLNNEIRSFQRVGNWWGPKSASLMGSTA